MLTTRGARIALAVAALAAVAGAGIASSAIPDNDG
jgi:hypothetical protein